MSQISTAPVDIASIISLLLGPIGPAQKKSASQAASQTDAFAATPSQVNDNLVRLIDLQYTGGSDSDGLLQQLSLKALIGPAWALLGGSDDGSGVAMTSPNNAGLYQVQAPPRDFAAGRAAARQAMSITKASQIGTLLSRIG